MAQWFYDRRHPTSWWFALALSLSILWLSQTWTPQTQRAMEQEWTALLETDMPAPVVSPAPPTPKVPSPMSKPLAPASTQAPLPSATPTTDTAVTTAPAAQAIAPAPAAVQAPASQPASELPKASRPAKSANYEALLLAQLERIKRYPSSREARISKPQGVVKLWLLISRQGELIDLGLAQSSGSNLLDGEALRTVRASRFPPFPEDAFEGAAQHRFTVSLKYEIEG